MAETIQTDWRKLAASQFPGFQIIGSGPFATFDGASNIMRLFQWEIEANFTGKKVQRIQIPQRRKFRRIFDVQD
jgi:hypothetical protein